MKTVPSSTKIPKTRTERDRTDESLHVERRKTDEEIEKRRTAIEQRSDAVVQQARGRADEVLEGARDRADETLSREGSSGSQRRALREERAEADATVHGERLAADERSRHERQDRLRALGHLLRLEREETDERLLVERARGDASLAARDDFMSMVSHDVRTLLGGIALSAELQIRAAMDDEAGRRSVATAEKIQRFTARINRLIGDLVDVASIEAGRFAIAPETQDAKELVRESLEAFQPAAAAKRISLEAEALDGGLRATFDQERMLQVLANLLSNAIKFTPEGGRVVVRVASAGSELRVDVQDTGVGISPDQLEPIFERFWQVTRADRRGLGLGLFISRSIVEAHGGRIWAESAVGAGSTFAFTLPGAVRGDQPPSTGTA